MLQADQIADIYPLTPTQRGMLFHTLYASHSGMYFQQEAFALQGELDRAAFRRAWEDVLARHAVLRSAVVWEGIDTPMQVVMREVRLPLEELDWREQQPDEQRAQLERFLEADRARGFDLVAAPLMRLALIRCADDLHQFVWSRHHLLLDGWSVSLLFREAFTCYTAFRQGRPPELEPARPYRDYLAWLQGQDRAQAEAFWRTTLAGFRTPTPLGVGRATSSTAGEERYAEQRLSLSDATTAALHSLARAQRLTINTLVQGAWALLLSRYSGEQDVVFGATGSGRPAGLAGVEGMVGMFISTLPVRVRVAPGERLGPWLHGILAQQARARHHDYTPLADVQSWSEVPRGAPLFESLVVFKNVPVAITRGDLGGELVMRDVQTFERTNYPLTLVVEPGAQLALQLIYDAARLEAATMARLLGHLQRLLEGFAADPAQRLADIPLLTEAERRALLALRAVPETPGASVCVHELFAAQAERTPEAVAVVFDAQPRVDEGRRTKDIQDKETRRQGDKEEKGRRRDNDSVFSVQRSAFSVQSLTYAELNERAERLARYLRGRGVGPEQRVAVCVERSVELVVGLLGVLKAGGACVLLDPADPPARLAFRLDVSQAPVLLTASDDPQTRRQGDKELGDLLVSLSPDLRVSHTVVDLRQDWSVFARQPATNPDGAARAAQLAAVLDASGRALMVEHGALAQRLERLNRSFALSETDAVLLNASPSADSAVWQLLWPLLHGARLVVARPEGQDDPEYLRQLIAEQAITVAQFAPSTLTAALAAWEHGSPSRLGSLRGVLCGGELASDTLARFQRQFACGLHRLYSPPEASAQLTTSALGADAERLPAPAAYILDDALRLLPFGVAGELYLAEPGLARGYLQQPDLTAERFIPNPFATTDDQRPTTNDQRPTTNDERRKTKDESESSSFVLRPSSGTRLYKTRDRARRLSDGSIEIVGSRAQHAWLDGVRVELGEVEAALLDDSMVEECVVLVRSAPDAGPELVAYVVTNGPFESERLHAHMSARLPAHLRPRAYVAVARLPLTPGGQIDERALAGMAVLDQELAQRWEEQLRALPEIEQVAVVAQEAAERLPVLHLSELLPHWSALPAAAPDASGAATAGELGGDATETPARPAFSDGGPLVIPPDAPRTLVEALVRTATQYPHKGMVHIQSDGSAIMQTYAQLLDGARRVASGLAALGHKPGDRAILQFTQLDEHLVVFWGCLLAGVAPVTVAVSPTYTEQTAIVNKLYNAWELLGHPPILASEQLIEPLSGLRSFLPMPDLTLRSFGQLWDSPPAEQLHQPDPHDLAFFQLTSGSTGVPKCIQETHHGVICHIHASAQVNGYNAADVTLNWLPFDHVGPLLMLHTKDVYLGCQQIQARTDMILGDPLRWLDLIEQYHATLTWAPNFAFKLLSERLSNVDKRWDLSSMRRFINAGEQVTQPVVREFLRFVEPFGVAPHAMQPAYGMAELCTAVVFVTDFDLASGVAYFAKSSLHGRLRRVSPDDVDAAEFIGVGPPAPGVQIRIVDRAGQLLTEGVIGRVEVRGEVVTPGYLNNPDANQEAFSGDGWFYTGDLGFLLDGRLTITGREKEIIIINGSNYYCYEIEDIVNELPGVAATYVGACAVEDARSGTEGLAIFFTPTVATIGEQVGLIRTIRTKLVAGIGLSPLYVVPVPRDEFPKTTSGKIQRTQLKTALAAGQFDQTLKELDLFQENDNTLPDWFYRKIWREQAARAWARPATGEALVLLDGHGLGAALVRKLAAQGQPCISVEVGERFERIDADRYRIAPGDAEQFRRLLEALAADGVQLERVVYLWSYGRFESAPAGSPESERALELGLYSLLALVQALAETNPHGRALRLDIVSSFAQAIMPGDVLACERSAMLGVIKTIPQELPWLRCRHIDLPFEANETSAAVEANAARVLREGQSTDKEREVAYREGRRLVARLERADLTATRARELPFKTGGLYLISGGLGGIARVLANYLRTEYDARLVLVGRRPLAAPGASADDGRRAAEDELRQLGEAVTYEALDVCDLDGLRGAVARAEARWQRRLDGVIHLASAHHERLLTEETREGFAAVLRPKLLGTWTLHQLVKDDPEALFIGFSSINSFFGGFSAGAYAAANSYLESFTQAQRANGARSYGYAWSVWERTGMSRGFQMGDLAQTRGYAAISPRQGLLGLLAGLAHEEPQLLIGLDRSKPAVGRLTMGEARQAQRLRAFFSTQDGAVPAERLRDLVAHDRYGNASVCDFMQLAELPKTADGQMDRQALPTPGGAASTTTAYAAPQTELERTLAALWSQMLGLEEIGIDDNFFELGGDSIRSLQVMSRAQEHGLSLSITQLFQYPTIRELANELEQNGAISGSAPPEPAPLASEQHPLLGALVREDGERSAPSPIRPYPKDNQLVPASYSQQRLWFIQQLDPANIAYNVRLLVRLAGPLDPAALEHGLNALVERHAILRTTFIDVAGEPVQRIAPTLRLTLPRFDLRDLPPNEREARALKLATAEAYQPFDLGQGPLIRAMLLQLDDAEYVFLLAMHHIVCDAWSLPIVGHELAEHYRAFTQGQLAPLPDLPIQYADYALWQREELQGEWLEAQLRYWHQQLAGVPELLALPTDRPRPPVQTFHGAAASVVLPDALLQRLRALSQRENATLAMILLAAFQVLLARYSGQTDIVVGTSLANRRQRELEQLIGPFYAILLLRADLSGRPSFRAFAGQARRVALEAYEHDDVPFEKLVEILQPARDPSYAPLAQVMFLFHNTPATLLTLPGLQIATFGGEQVTTQYDLLLRLGELDGTLAGQLEYNTDLFDAPTMARMVGHFCALLESIVADPDQPVSALSLVAESERRQLTTLWQGAAEPLPSQCWPQLFEAQVARTPGAVAIMFDRRPTTNDQRPTTDNNSQPPASSLQQLTYVELNARANRLAHWLVAQGVGPEVCVGLLAARSLDFLVALVGILKAGGVYVPLDPNHPARRMAEVLTQSRCALVLASTELTPLLTESLADLPAAQRPRWVALEALAQPDYPATNGPPRCSLQNLAYVMYTSGSTGTPKGAMVEYAGMHNHMLAKINDLQLSAADTVAQNGPQCFDISVWQFLAPLLLGGRVLIVPDEIARDPAGLLEQIVRREVTLVQLVPSLLQALVRELEVLGADRPALPALRWIIPTGDALTSALSRSWLKLYPHIPLLNNYGSTECSDDHCHYPIHHPLAPDYRLPIMPIGRPIPNTFACVLDQHLAPVPIGVVGEFYTSGIAVGRGYLGRPDLTAARFIPNPFALSEDERRKTKDEGNDSSFVLRPSSFVRLYKTGDLVRYLPDGSIEFLGRIDARVKIHGLRIELDEIAAALRRHPAVEEAVVLVREDRPGDQRLVAYVVPTTDQRPTTNDQRSEDKERGRGEEGEDSNLLVSLSPPLISQAPSFVSNLRNHLKQTLPGYMVPAAIVRLDALPLTPNGKIDRSALQTLSLPEAARPELDDDFVAPQTALEIQLAQIWAEVLGVEAVSSTANFFDLGGDSFKAIRVVRQFGAGLTLLAVFKYPVLRDLAAQLTAGEQRSNGVLQPLLPPNPHTTLSLVCVPYGGGSAIVYQPLAKALPKQYALYSVALPGHDFDSSAESMQSVEEVARRCADEILANLRGPIALYGHCAGTAIAVEIARLLEAAGATVEAVFLGGALPGTAGMQRVAGWFAKLSKRPRPVGAAELLVHLRSMGGFTEVQDAEELSFALKGYLHDDEDASHYFMRRLSREQPRKLNAPIVCLMGDRDRVTRNYAKRYKEWAAFSSAVRLEVIRGGDHYFIKHHAEAVAQIIQSTLDS